MGDYTDFSTCALELENRNGPICAIQPADIVPTGNAPDNDVPGYLLNDSALGDEYFNTATTPTRRDEIENELDLRVMSGLDLAEGKSSPTYPANANVTPEVAIEIMKNLSKGENAWRPDLCKNGGSAFFVSEGTPYVGIDPTKNITIDVELTETKDVMVFKEAELLEIFKQEEAGAEAEFRQRFHIDPNKSIDNLSSKMRNIFKRFKRSFAESRMWTRVGEKVRNSASKVGEVVLQRGSYFSQEPGKFAVVADAAKIKVKGGLPRMIELTKNLSAPAEPVILEAAEKMANKLKWAGRVRTAFRYGGRVLIIVAVAADVYKVYVAQDKTKAIITSLAGWAGAGAASTAFAIWWTPADVAGPWAWAGHGVGTLIAGGVGYWAGSETTRTIYELIVED